MSSKPIRRTVRVLATSAILSSAGILGAQAAEPPPKPPLFAIAAYDIGTSGYNEPMAATEGVLKKFGIKSRLLPLSNNLARMRAARSGQVSFFVTSSDAVFSRRAWHEWSAKEWGPQKVRLLWQTNRSSSFTIATRGDSNIRSIKDLKGKKLSFLVGSPSGNAITEAYLNFEGLKWDDVTKVNVPGYSAAWEALAQGVVDAAGGSTWNTQFQQMQAGPYGVRFLELPYPPDHPGWAFFEQIYPTIFPAKISLAVGLKPGESIQIFSFPFPDVMAYDGVDANLGYWMLKSIAESHNEFKDIAPTMKDWTLERSLAVPLKLAPYHVGAVQYLKDVGLWTDALQKAQDELLKEEADYIACWTKADAAHSSAKPAQEWPQFWKTYAEKECGLLVRI